MYLDFEISLGVTEAAFPGLLRWAEAELNIYTFDRLTYMWETLPAAHKDKVQNALRDLVTMKADYDKNSGRVATEEKVGDYSVKYASGRDERIQRVDPKAIIARHLLHTGLMYKGYSGGEPYGF